LARWPTVTASDDELKAEEHPAGEIVAAQLGGESRLSEGRDVVWGPRAASCRASCARYLRLPRHGGWEKGARSVESVSVGEHGPPSARALPVSDVLRRICMVLAMSSALSGCGGTKSDTGQVGSPARQDVTATSPANRVAPRSRHQTPPGSQHATAQRSGSARCQAPSAVLAGVYHPERLQVMASCRVAAGTVVRVHHEPDGDLHIDVALDFAYSMLINEVNRSEQGGSLLAEFMPRDGGHLATPSVGDHIRLTGAWVDDTDHGWNELHPVWSVQINGGAISRSGPQYGGSPAYDRSSDAAEGCRDQSGSACSGYGASSAGGYTGGSGLNYRSGPEGTSSQKSGGPSLSSPQNSALFCTAHQCISSFERGTGTIVQCADGEWSHSGGRPGVCSRHGGVKE
jgi:hypothetical protein